MNNINNNVRLQHFEKNDTINNEIYKRNIPSTNIQMSFDSRPVSTKYSVMPIIDHKKPSDVKINILENYDTNETFFPGTSKPHYSGFANNIDNESLLRSQFFALQNCYKQNFIPSTKSNLYNHEIFNKTTNIDLDSETIFKKEQFNNFNPNISNNIGNSFFHNNTRVQLKNL